jgi:hypothetical protein
LGDVIHFRKEVPMNGLVKYHIFFTTPYIKTLGSPGRSF